MSKHLGNAVYVLLILVTLALGIGMWKVARWWNYTYNYKTQVTDTVKSMVKPECLK
jgi:hypothetical protein